LEVDICEWYYQVVMMEKWGLYFGDVWVKIFTFYDSYLYYTTALYENGFKTVIFSFIVLAYPLLSSSESTDGPPVRKKGKFDGKCNDA